jgi:hypothetical protein
MSWARAGVSNRMARDGAAWVSMFAGYNSGTYNNMWIVVNYNRWVPFQPLSNGTLYILEQLPEFTQVGHVGYRALVCFLVDDDGARAGCRHDVGAHVQPLPLVQSRVLC